MKAMLLFLGAAALLSAASSYKILCIFPVPSKSHNNLAKGVVNILLKAGHEVTWATPYPDKKSVANLTQIDVSATLEYADVDMSKHQDLAFVFAFAKNVSHVAAHTPALREALVKQRFDAVFTEWFFNEFEAGYAAVQQVPWLLLSGTALGPPVQAMVDEVRTLSTIPLPLNDYTIPMGFWQRLFNVAVYAVLWTKIYGIGGADLEHRYQSTYAPLAAARGVTLPPYAKAYRDVSILFVNSHQSISPAQSLPPNVVDIAGYHISSHRTPLPKDIQELLDSSPQGVVYFSMGSVMKSELIPVATRQALLKLLGALPYTVLWKFEEQLEGLPPNVHISSWWPQPGILAHPNVKLFITHGGMLSMLEAVHYGVPLLAIPVFGDQPSNAARAERLGFARKVTYAEDMAPAFGAALNELLKDDTYYKRAKYLSKLFNSRPLPPTELVAYYTELAIETKGAHHLRSQTLHYAWYQVWMLDLIAFVVAVIVALGIVIRVLLSKLFGRKTQAKVKRN